MATKTDRILGYLPPTFRGLPRPTALFSVVDAVGEQLLQAENSLGEVMLSHWVDHADSKVDFIADLACFAALYGLAPRGAIKDVARFQAPTCVPVSAVETVEEFREHLKRYVRTFLEGTVTVQGILRIVAEALGIHIADSYSDMDTWWTRGNDPLILTRRRADDAAAALFGNLASLEARGAAAYPARVTGKKQLSEEFDLSLPSELRIGVDGAAPIAIDLSLGQNASLRDVVTRINQRLSASIANRIDGRLVLTSPTVGAKSRLTIAESRNDASNFLLGLSSNLPRTFTGADATAARLVGTIDLSQGADLRSRHLLQIAMDSGEPVQIDLCATLKDRKAVRLPELQTVLNIALASPVASDDGKHLVLTSANTGPGSSIAVLQAQETSTRRFVTRAYITDEAATAVFRFIRRKATGTDATPARLVSKLDLSQGVDIRTNPCLRLAVDGVATEIDCAARARIPRAATLSEIIDGINAGVNRSIASGDSHHLILTSPTTGATSRISLEPTEGDARSSLFGQGPYNADGQDGRAAALKGQVDLARSVDLAQRSVLRLAVDGGPAIDIDVAGAVPDRTTIDEIVSRINSMLPRVASADDHHLVLHSPTAGGQSSVEVLPLRALELIDYPPVPITEPPVTLREADRFSLINDGAADSEFEFDLRASQGESGMEFVDRTAGTRIRVMAALPADGKLALRPCGGIGISAEITALNGTVKRLPDSSILAGRIGAQAQIPFTGEWLLSRPSGPDPRPALQLNNPGAPAVLNLHALREFNPGEEVAVQVAEARSAIGGSRILTMEPNHIRAIGRLRSDASGYSLVSESGGEILRLQGGRQSDYPPPDRLVGISGAWHATKGEPRTVVPDRVTPLFDVRLQFTSPGGDSTVEVYSGVAIGDGDTPLSLQFKLLDRPSQLARAFELSKAASLRFTRGSAELTYMNCHEARFNQVMFASEPFATGPTAGEIARFAGGLCREWAVFDISRFSDVRADGEAALFSASATSPDPPVQVVVDWTKHELGAFVVNLPVDLDEEFGARFNQDRFGMPPGAPEQYNGVITEPATDRDYIVKRINAKSTLVQATTIPRTPVGFRTVQIPFLHPRSRMLSGGTDTESARIYLAEVGVPGVIELQASTKGAWGNSIVITAKGAGNVRFDVTVGYVGLRFENARTVALAGRILGPREDPLSQLAAQLLKPGPIGALQAKAAGIRVDITRDRTGAPPAQNSYYPLITGTTQRREHAR